ncbi:MAG: hypothetical protein K6F88_04505 [Ruminococcus sp.]|nr:hypothetical protein [Ruminococcus sp.]
MKKIISIFTAAALALSMFCVSFTSFADTISVSFHANNTCYADADNDVFKSVNVSSGTTAVSGYDIPNVNGRFIFKGWYYGKEADAQPVDFSNDTFSANTDVYAHWADIGVVTADARDDSGTGVYDGFDMVGVQQRAGELESINGGLRFIGAVSNSLLAELDDLSANAVSHENEGEPELTYGANNNVEYGFVAAAQSRIEAWKNSSYAPSEYELGYKGTNVNGVNTRNHNSNYQPVMNIDCTASDYSDSSITDYKKYSGYRLYSLAVTYENASQHDNKALGIRAYLRYYDANGLLRTVYDDYDGTNEYGGLCTSYTAVRDTVVNVGYYSTIEGMFSDANNMSVENSDSSAADAAASMYISGGRAYMKLLKNASLTSIVTLNANKNADFDLNGYTLSEDINRIISYADFCMYDGTVTADSSTSRLCSFAGDLTRLSNVSFVVQNLEIASDSSYIGIYNAGNDVYFTNCSFNIGTSNAAAGNCYAMAFVNTKNAVVRGCRYEINAEMTGQSKLLTAIYSNGSALTVDDSSFSLEQIAHKPQIDIYGIMIWNSDNALLKDTDITISGECDFGCGLIASNGSSQSGTRFFEARSVEVTMDIDDLYKTAKSVDEDVLSKLDGLCIGSGEKAVLNDVKTDITVAAVEDAFVFGIQCASASDTTASGLDIDIKTKNNAEDSYRLYGIVTFDSSALLLKSGEINVLPVMDNRKNVECSVGIRAENTSSVTIDPESDDDVLIQGGNTALGSDMDAVFTITGGKFCSPSHGGAYLGGNAVITGGEFYSYYLSGHAEEGAFYVTHDANVDISNAVIRTSPNARRAFRTRNNIGANGQTYYGNPVVNIRNTTVSAPIYAFEISTGVVYLHNYNYPTDSRIQAGTAAQGNVVWVND